MKGGGIAVWERADFATAAAEKAAVAVAEAADEMALDAMV
jgi:hypothetical protein